MKEVVIVFVYAFLLACLVPRLIGRMHDRAQQSQHAVWKQQADANVAEADRVRAKYFRSLKDKESLRPDTTPLPQ